jgi:hypothetical protein
MNKSKLTRMNSLLREIDRLAQENHEIEQKIAEADKKMISFSKYQVNDVISINNLELTIRAITCEFNFKTQKHEYYYYCDSRDENYNIDTHLVTVDVLTGTVLTVSNTLIMEKK